MLMQGVNGVLNTCAKCDKKLGEICWKSGENSWNSVQVENLIYMTVLLN